MILRELGHIDLAPVDRTLRRFIGSQQKGTPRAGEHGHSLWQDVLDHTTNGKRLRSRLVILAAGTETARGARAGAREGRATAQSGAVEAVAAAYGLLHAAFVLHDDVIDRDGYRYGRPALHASYAATAASQGWPDTVAVHRGYTRSILAGDLALASAYRLMLTGTQECHPAVRERLQTVLHDTVLTTTLGELLDVELALPPDVADTAPDHDPVDAALGTAPNYDPLDAALGTAELKTAGYTFQAPLVSGALLAGLPEEQIRALGHIGQYLGIAYQLEDDLLGVFGSSEQTGKPVGGDLREGKHTHLIASALVSGRACEVRELLGAAASAEEAELPELNTAMQKLLVEIGAREVTAHAIDDHTARAIDCLDATALPEPLDRALRSFAAGTGRSR